MLKKASSFRNLTSLELVRANALLKELREQLRELAGDDADLLEAYQQTIARDLTHEDRRKPMRRMGLKTLKRKLQGGLCAECGEPLSAKYTALGRKRGTDGGTAKNTELLCAECDRKREAGESEA